MNTIDFITLMAPIARVDQHHTSVLASITIAQAILESASGGSAPGNNLFGIKGKGQQLDTKEYVNGEWVTIKDSFRVYDSWSDSVRDHSDFLLDNIRYTRSGFFERCRILDYKGAAQALQNAGYATDPQYATKLIGLIEAYKLWQYDMEAEATMEDMLKRIETLEDKVTQLLNKVRVLDVTSPPKWFVDEFGVDALAGIAHEPIGDVDFWRNTAITLRLKNKG
ncbi:MAG: glycoside hydrolase family 73 protein [Paenibacillaceae bacterium]